ncbi:MAG: SIMPL domain-containing protein [Heliobacteriaceae bacterium]|nr:SIMPL domain-containing protein [Heliobacteriaceae bacterium]MDD4586797.1 SIMPL domain-containing protein [Heliobacteriaceae bacterium]
MLTQKSIANKVVAVFLGLIIFAAFYLSTHRVPPAPLDPVVALDPREGSITVSGYGTVPHTTEAFRLVLAVQQGGRSALEADNNRNRVLDELLKALNGLGVAGEAIKTGGRQLQPLWPDSTEGRRPAPQGFLATSKLEVSGLATERQEEVVKAALANGATQILLAETYRLPGPEASQEALQLALADAKNRAKQIAASMGRDLGDLVAVDETGTGKNLPETTRLPDGTNEILTSQNDRQTAATTIRIIAVYRLKY